MNRLFTFEAFTKEYLDKMIDNKDTYLFKNIRSRSTLSKIDLKIKKYIIQIFHLMIKNHILQYTQIKIL